MRRLRSGAEGQVLAAGIALGDAAARLERHVGLAVLRKTRLDDARGARKCRVEVAGREGLMRDAIGTMLWIEHSLPKQQMK